MAGPVREERDPGEADARRASSRTLAWLLALAALAAAAAVAVLWIVPHAELRAGVLRSWHGLQAAPPAIYFGAMALVCLGPVPISIFYVTAGPLYGIGGSLLWIAPAILVNQLLAHTLAAGVLRPAVARVLTSRGYTVPRVERSDDQTLFTILVRITPGFPYFLQNLTLGLASVDLVRTLSISLPIQMVWATGFVVLGRSAFEGRIGLAVGALALIVLLSIVARVVHRRLARTRSPGGESDAN